METSDPDKRQCNSRQKAIIQDLNKNDIPRPPPQSSSPRQAKEISPHRTSGLNGRGLPSSPGLRNRKSVSSSDGCHLSFSHEQHQMTNSNDETNDNDVKNVSIGVQQEHDCSNTEQQQQEPPTQDDNLVTSFWRTYDDIIILSLFSIFGIVFRLFSATWFRLELGVVFSEDSALGTNLPLNCCSCFLLGLLCSGRDAIGIVYSKALGGSNPYGHGRGIFDVGRGAYRGAINAGRSGFNRARGYGNLGHNSQNQNECTESNVEVQSRNSESFYDNETANTNKTNDSGLNRRKNQTSPPTISDDASAPNRNMNVIDPISMSPNSHVSDDASIAGLLGFDEEFRIGNRSNGEDEIREVQLRALTRRIMASPSLVLFPAKKVDVDVIEHYERYSSNEGTRAMPRDSNFILENHFEIGDLDDEVEVADNEVEHVTNESRNANNTTKHSNVQQNHAEQRVNNQHTTPTNSTRANDTNASTFHRLYGLNFSEGWDVGTSAEEMKHQILLGLRVGFCGAVSTWSSWNSAMISLLQAGKIGEALVGYAMGIQLGVVCYRFGQQLAVYIFVFRRRREAKRDARRGYGLRLQIGTDDTADEGNEGNAEIARNVHTFSSVRVIVTVIFATVVILAFCTIFFFPQHQQFAMSLLFTPFGCIGRWKLQQKYNRRLPGFPLGTFSCNLLSVALSGSLGSFLAGNPGPEERIGLTSMIAGFAGSLSTFAGYISEVLALVDPIIFKFDGFAYAIITVLWGAIIGFFSSQAKNWADEI